MSAVSGAFHELDALVRKVAAISGEGSRFHEGMLKACATAALGALDDSFISSIDPYGKPWKPVVRGGKPLQDTGRLASGFTSRVVPLGFAIETNIAYAPTHQYGATIVPVVARRLAWKPRGGGWRFANKVTIPRRQMVPEAGTGGIGRWGAAINEEADAFMKAWLK